MFEFAQNQTHFCTTTITHQKLLHDVRVCVDSTSVFERVNQRFQYGVFFSIRKLINCVTHCLAIVVFQSLLGAFFHFSRPLFSFKIEWHCRSDSQYWFGVCSPHIAAQCWISANSQSKRQNRTKLRQSWLKWKKRKYIRFRARF